VLQAAVGDPTMRPVHNRIVDYPSGQREFITELAPSR